MSMNQKYEDYFRQKEMKRADESELMAAQIKASNGPAVKDLSGGIPESDFNSAPPAAAPSSGAGMSAPQGGSPAALLGQAGMMSGNPYLMAGGLGLQVLASGEQNKRAQENAQREAYNQRIKDRQAMMAQIAEMGIK